MVVDAKRRAGRAVVVATQNISDAGGLQIAMQRSRQPKGQQHQGGEAADVSHERTERRTTGFVNVMGDSFVRQLKVAGAALGYGRSSIPRERGERRLLFSQTV